MKNHSASCCPGKHCLCRHQEVAYNQEKGEEVGRSEWVWVPQPLEGCHFQFKNQRHWCSNGSKAQTWRKTKSRSPRKEGEGNSVGDEGKSCFGSSMPMKDAEGDLGSCLTVGWAWHVIKLHCLSKPSLPFVALSRGWRMLGLRWAFTEASWCCEALGRQPSPHLVTRAVGVIKQQSIFLQESLSLPS